MMDLTQPSNRELFVKVAMSEGREAVSTAKNGKADVVDSEKVFAATAAIYSAVVTHTATGAVPDPDARAELESEIDILRDNCPGNCMGTVLSLSSWLDIFYSAHRHQRYSDAGNEKKGIDIVMADICLCLRRIDDRVRERPELNPRR